MTTKAEELAQLIAAEVGRLLPDETPANTRAVAEKALAAGLQNTIEQYGRSVQEAAAAHAEQQEYDCYGLCAKAIREMPLP